MSTPDKLLGGHAPNTLTDAEKARLYGASLEDQALFDQLMDEEALRDLLADPIAKARLLEALAPPRTVPFHRRPWVLGTAACLVMGLVTAWQVLRTQPATAQPVLPAPSIQEAAPAPVIQAAPASAALLAPVPGKATAAPAPKIDQAVPAPPPLTEAAPAPVEPKAFLGATAAREEKPSAVPALDREATHAVEVVAATASHDRAKAEMGAQAFKRMAPALTDLPKGKAETVLFPLWRMEDAGLGRTRLHLTLRQGGHPYLLCRTEEGVRLVPGEGSGPERTWLIQPTPGARWDLYVLPNPAQEPTRLPEKTLREGWHQRLPL